MNYRLADKHFYAIIPAGGVGSRLWPLSRADAPKFLLDLTGSGKTLLESTFERIVPLTGPDRVFVVTGYAHRAAVKNQLPRVLDTNIFLEPSPRDSTAAICVAAAIIARRDPDAIVGSFPADHLVTAPAEFRHVVREAVEVAKQGYITTVGITPTGPSVAFGYIETGDAVDAERFPNARHVSRFVEKPEEDVARGFLADGKHLWNAGMFIAKAQVLLDVLRENRPRLAEAIDRIADVWGTPEQFVIKDQVWPDLEKIAIDYSIAEPAARDGKVAVVPGDFGWDDVGDFFAVARHLANRGSGSLAILGDRARVISDRASGIVVGETDRVVAVIGMEDVVVVDTDDALLVTNAQNAQRIKQMVDFLRASGRGDVL